MRISWDGLEPQRYEDMVSVLLSRLYPDAQRIDGKGGDGGRDLQIVDDQNSPITCAFELKSFTGRFTTGRRKQVERSLKRAASLAPASWTLVVPIDPTPAEDRWFRQLGKSHSFPIGWYGKTWLDEKMSTFPDIRRYFLEKASDEVVRLLKELREEQARSNDVSEVVERFRTLRERMNEIDPHYRYELSTGTIASDVWHKGVVYSVCFHDMRVDVYPKYSGATKDRPVTVKFNVIVDTDDDVALNAFNYGLETTIPSHLVDGVSIDAPSGLACDLAEAELVLVPINSLDKPITLALDIMDGDKVLVSWPVRLTERTTGLRGFTLAGTDSTGWLQTCITMDERTKVFDAKFRLTPRSTMPGALLPLFQWIDALKPPYHLRFRWQGQLEPRIEIPKTLLADHSIGKVVEALAYLQERLGSYWEMSPSLTPEEMLQILEAANMLKEECTEFAWESLSLRLDPLKPAIKELMDGHSHAFLSTQDVRIELEGLTVAIVRVQNYLESARLANPDAVERALKSGSVPQLILVPGESDKGRRAAQLLPSLGEYP
ncbi:MAG: hypothetical protein OXG64_03995 [Chloroflexi bacterium]|nr:hypothetical protein [Chloroflexota bacterium]